MTGRWSSVQVVLEFGSCRTSSCNRWDQLQVSTEIHIVWRKFEALNEEHQWSLITERRTSCRTSGIAADRLCISICWPCSFDLHFADRFHTLRFRSAFCRSICWVYDFDLHFADRFAESTISICILQIDLLTLRNRSAFCRSISDSTILICILQIDLLNQRFWSAFCRSIELTMHFPIDLPIDFAKQIDFYFWHKCHSIV